jgi:hypothetical protein
LSAKRMIKLGLCLLLALAASACIGESPEVAEAKADYIEAKAELVGAEAAQTEAKTRQIEEQTESAKQYQEGKMALLRECSQALVQLAQILLPWALGFVGAALVVALSGLIGRHVIEAERQRQQARAQALREERRLMEVWAAAVRHPVPLADSGGDGHKPATIAGKDKVDILQLLQRLREQYPV